MWCIFCGRLQTMCACRWMGTLDFGKQECQTVRHERHTIWNHAVLHPSSPALLILTLALPGPHIPENSLSVLTLVLIVKLLSRCFGGPHYKLLFFLWKRVHSQCVHKWGLRWYILQCLWNVTLKLVELVTFFPLSFFFDQSSNTYRLINSFHTSCPVMHRTF